VNTYDWFKENIVNLAEFPAYDPTNRIEAMTRIMETGGLLTGLIYQNKERKSYEDMIVGFKEESLSSQSLDISREAFDRYNKAYG
jgi:2-oxoglutarate ferredoxin oxidoreductase subunit beta